MKDDLECKQCGSEDIRPGGNKLWCPNGHIVEETKVVDLASMIGPSGSKTEAAICHLISNVDGMMQACDIHKEVLPEAEGMKSKLLELHEQLHELLANEWRRR